ncbi:hypothetical protein QR680_015029 [Steinernema hermaphroditum]|uniref:Uncharacterized protein n=1 Tax=Steinernema hermaphroditum TaxID=289476 RepID=A0AA39IAV0_9BILA|nr:hypothetical protein QR680_015029 [Steinernema hermaphroditum]
MKSTELAQVDIQLSRAINESFRGNAYISSETLKKCQKLLSLHPEFNEFCSRLDNDFAHLPVDIIVDVIRISEPFSSRYEHALKRYFLVAYSNMAKVKGSWGVQARALKSFEYSIEDDTDEDYPIEKTFFDESGEHKTQRIALNEINSVLNDFIHSADLLLCKPALTTVDIYVASIDRPLEEFLTRQLKSRVLRTFRLIIDYGPHLNEEWNDLFAKFVKKDDFISLVINTDDFYSRRIIEGAVEKWMRSTVRTNQEVYMHLTQEDRRLCEEYFDSLAESKTHNAGRNPSNVYSIKHPSNSESSLSVQISDETRGCCIEATFSVIPETAD